MYIDSGLVKKYESFSDLRKKVEEEKILKIKNRLDKNPSPTTTESILGAFLEMYQPQVFPFIPVLIEKGYLVEPSSGFCGKYQECQALNGLFPIDDTIINRLLKIKVKVFKSTRSKSIKFWPESADLKKISDKKMEILVGSGRVFFIETKILVILGMTKVKMITIMMVPKATIIIG